MKLQFELPNVCQNEKISQIVKYFLSFANFLLSQAAYNAQNPAKYCYLTGTKQKTNTMNNY